MLKYLDLVINLFSLLLGKLESTFFLITELNRITW